MGSSQYETKEPVYTLQEKQSIIFQRFNGYGIERIIIKNVGSIIEKFEINLSELYLDPEKLKQKIIDVISKTSIDEIFNDSSNSIETAFDQLKEKLFEFDKTISDTSTKYKQKIFHYMEELKGKAVDAQKRKHETTLRQIDKVTNVIFPGTNLQEREVNFIYFANKYGTNILKQIFDELSINKFEHQIINL